MKKKMLLATALLITGLLNVAQQTKQNKTNQQQQTHHPSFLHFFVWGIGKKLSMQPKFGGAENVVKTETQQTFVNGLLGFITLGIYTPLEVCIVLLTIIA